MFKSLKTIATLVNYTCKSCIKLTPAEPQNSQKPRRSNVLKQSHIAIRQNFRPSLARNLQRLILKVTWPSIFLGTPSIFGLLDLNKFIFIILQTIITDVLQSWKLLVVSNSSCIFYLKSEINLTLITFWKSKIIINQDI